MGNNQSDRGIVDYSDGSSHGNKSRIMSFHSKNEGKIHLTTSNLSNKLIVIDFTATWCGPCRSMEPVLKEYADKYTDVEFVKLDVDEFVGKYGSYIRFQQLMWRAMEFGVQAMPSFVFIKNGEVIDRVVGARKEELQTKIEKHRS